MLDIVDSGALPGLTVRWGLQKTHRHLQCLLGRCRGATREAPRKFTGGILNPITECHRRLPLGDLRGQSWRSAEVMQTVTSKEVAGSGMMGPSGHSAENEVGRGRHGGREVRDGAIAASR